MPKITSNSHTPAIRHSALNHGSSTTVRKGHTRGTSVTASSPQKILKSFDMTAHQYGIFFSGFDWTVYFCGTFRSRMSLENTERVLTVFWKRLEKKLSWSPVAMLAVRERRTSGCGHPAIPADWHILMTVPPDKRELLLPAAVQIWNQIAGDCHAVPYDRREAGAFYMAKLAKGSNFDWVMTRETHLIYGGPADIPEACQTDDYVPEHMKDQTHGETLVLRKLFDEQRAGNPPKFRIATQSSSCRSSVIGGHRGRHR